mmetsp:Transcript_65752/g.129067  ORF Transcript_65752/g.129067 Transcript_65752/m.129067 type:complete len:198 (+) Transcript_65752:71-664(+)
MMASQSDQPAWMSDGQAEEYIPPPAPAGGYAPAGFSGSAFSENTDKKFYIKMAVKVVLVGMSVMMLANGVLALSSLNNSSNVVSDVFVAIYIGLFASLLFFHEMTQFYPMEQVDEVVKRNFGFLFKPLGKGAFIVFIAFLNFGLTVNSNLGLATGICLCITGAGYIVLYLRNPEFFEDEASRDGKANLPPYVPQSGV